jgi:hypothetical protein
MLTAPAVPEVAPLLRWVDEDAVVMVSLLVQSWPMRQPASNQGDSAVGENGLDGIIGMGLEMGFLNAPGQPQ